METSRLCLCPSPPPSKTQRFGSKIPSPRSTVIAAAKRSSSSSENSSWSSVDESMIVLRKRIHQMKAIERNYEPPEEWSEWEKQLYARYDEHVCAFVGALQSALMSARPSVALGIVATVALSVPVSALAVALRFAEMANVALSSIHLG